MKYRAADVVPLSRPGLRMRQCLFCPLREWTFLPTPFTRRLYRAQNTNPLYKHDMLTKGKDCLNGVVPYQLLEMINCDMMVAVGIMNGPEYQIPG